MFQTIRSACSILGLLILITGILYPLGMTGIAQLIFPMQANGSIEINQTGQAVGSRLIGQLFSDPLYFWGRPSVTADKPYNAMNSGGSNFSVLNPQLENRVKDTITSFQSSDEQNNQPIPVDLVTSSASGLDPHISPASAYYQAARIARYRNLKLEQVTDLIDREIEKPFLGIFGESRVNVLILNIGLDELQ